jgi:hypothetical protein
MLQSDLQNKQYLLQIKFDEPENAILFLSTFYLFCVHAEVAKENDQEVQIYVYEAERTLKKNESLDDNFRFLLRFNQNFEKVDLFRKSPNL